MSHSIERYHDISCGHRVYGHESKCAHLHGHNYRITFTCVAVRVEPQRKFIGQPEQRGRVGELDEIGRVIDFSVVKERLCEWLEENWDHKMLLWEQDPDLMAIAKLDPQGVVAVPFNPTAENMASYLVNVVAPAQLEGTAVALVTCKVEETRKCSATYSL